MCKRRDRSVVGRSIDLGLMRMTGSALVGGLAKVIRRRVEVLHLSADGETALLGVPGIKEEDARELVIDEEGMEFLKQDVHVFRLGYILSQQTGMTSLARKLGVADSSEGRPDARTGRARMRRPVCCGENF